MSPDGIRAAIDAASRLDACQKAHDACMAELPEAVFDELSMMEWLCRFTLAADHRDVTGRDFTAVIRHLEAAGYRRDALTGLSPCAYNDPHTMAAWIAGQAIDYMMRGWPPHGVTLKFAGQYRAALRLQPPEPDHG